jgi:bacterioferritin (cytochrome b1)
MEPSEAIAALNQLLGLLCSSLPAYLADARPWTRIGRVELRLALDRLTADQRLYARRVAAAVERLGGLPDTGRFPSTFAAKHDLAAEHLLREIIKSLDHDAAAAARLAEKLENDAALHALAEEIVGNLKGHRDTLKAMR